MNKIILIVLVIVGVLVLISLGYMSQINKKIGEITETETTPLISALSRLGGLKMVSQWSFSVAGRVEEINNRIFTLRNSGENLVIKLAEDATFVLTVLEEGKDSSLTPIRLEDVKVGDQAVILGVVSSDGTLGGRRVRVRP
ncbi:MAG: hypothetical protein Q7K28_02720 [Candidatus Wildermuthbacteria bacterium]|nr:hypothetical protein [Candidatus Wildermuthbacteria bacterium]